MKRLLSSSSASLSFGLLMALAGCGGGSSGESTSAPVVQGTAAVGSPIAQGALSLRCAGGERSAVTDDTGRYQIDTSGLTLPCTMSVSGGKVDGKDSAWVLSTAISSAPAVANLTPWTHLVMARLLGADPGAAMPGMTPEDIKGKLTASSLSHADAAVRTELGRLFGAPPAAGIDPIATPFIADSGTGMDGLLIQLMAGLRQTAKTLTQAAQEIATGPLQIKEVPSTCIPAVLSGFTGKFDDVSVQVPYTPPTDSGGGGGGSAGGSGGSSGAGAGGSLGQFLNAIVRVERVDGSLLGEAVTDKVKGMVTIVPCRYQGPVRVSIKAKADGSSQYFEETTGKYTTFPAGEEMNALLPSVSKNLGITLLTEAAWQYVQAKYGAEGWKTVAHIEEANTTVAQEFNKFLPKDLQVADITRLPFLVSGSTKAGSIDFSKNGIYGIVSSGLARVAGLMRSGDLAPALKLVRQLGRDLCDGTIDLTCHGVPVVADAKDAAYLPSQFGETLNRGVGEVAAACGDKQAGEAAFRVTQAVIETKLTEGGPLGHYWIPTYHEQQAIRLLRSDGKLFYWKNRQSEAIPYLPEHSFNRIFPQSGFGFAGLDSDGSLLTEAASTGSSNGPTGFFEADWSSTTAMAGYSQINGDNSHYNLWSTAQIARLSNGHVRYYPSYSRDSPYLSSKEVLLNNVVSVSVSYAGYRLGSDKQDAPWFYALTADGTVNHWSSNPPPHDSVYATPSAVSGLPPISSVTGAAFSVYAIDRDGRVWGWSTSNSTSPTAPALRADVNAFGPIQQISCGVLQGCAALTRTGKLIAWGKFGNGLANVPPELIVESKVFPVTEVPLPAGQHITYLNASADMIYGLVDNGNLVVFPSYPTAPKFIDTSKVLPLSDGASISCPK